MKKEGVVAYTALRRLKRLIKKYILPIDSTDRSILENERMRDHDQIYSDVAEWVITAQSDKLDSSIVLGVKRAALDAIVSILLGVASKEGCAIIKFIESSTNADGRCFIPGSSKTFSCSESAYSMVALAQVHDVNDGHATAGNFGGSYHPGRVVVPTSLAAAQANNLTGLQFLSAISIGYDVALNIMGGPLGGSSDAYGAAALVSYANNLTESETAFAIKLSGFSSSQTGGQDFEVNNLTCAQQAKGAVDAIELIRCGYPISNGFNPLRGGFKFNKPVISGDKLNELYFKPYPTCRYIHPFIDAVLEIRHELIGYFDQIKKIDLYVPPGGASGTTHRIGSGEYYKSYQFSMSYCVAASLLDGTFGLEQVTPNRTDNQQLQELQSLVEFNELDQSMIIKPISGLVRVELVDGKVFSHQIDNPYGSPENPLSNEAIVMKLSNWTVLTTDDARRLLECVMEVDKKDSIEELISYIQLLGNKLIRSV